MRLRARWVRPPSPLHERCVNGTVIFPDRDRRHPSAGLGVCSPRPGGRGNLGGGGLVCGPTPGYTGPRESGSGDGPAWCATPGCRALRLGARRYGAVLLAGAALAGTAAARVPVPVGGPQSAASAATVAAQTAPRKLLRADVMVVAQKALPAKDVARVARLRGVQAARAVDAARIRVNGTFAAVLGVDPDTFRAFAAGPTASSSPLWQNVANGAIAVSYTMGKQDRLPLGGTVQVAGRTMRPLRVAGFGTVGIGGVDAVISRIQAQALGIPAGNAIVVSAPHARLATLIRRSRRGCHGEPWSSPWSPRRRRHPGRGRGGGIGARREPRSASPPRAGWPQHGRPHALLTAAVSRVGHPSRVGRRRPDHVRLLRARAMVDAQAGLVMPRVAADQARTGARTRSARPRRATCSSTAPTRPPRPTSRTWPSTWATPHDSGARAGRERADRPGGFGAASSPGRCVSPRVSPPSAPLSRWVTHPHRRLRTGRRAESSGSGPRLGLARLGRGRRPVLPALPVRNYIIT